MRLKKIISVFGKFRRDDQGVVSIEFIVMLPLLMLWLIGSFVFFDAFRSYSQSSKATYTLGDIMSRQVTVDNNFITGLFDLVDWMTPRSGNGKWMRISSIVYDLPADTYSVQWSRNEGGGVVLIDTTIPISLMPIMADNDTVILTETYVPYTPIASWVGISNQTWATRLVTRPRFVGRIVKTN